MIALNLCMAGFFACAALHYAIHWSRSRGERALLVFSIQCAAYTGFHLFLSSYFGAKTVADCQVALDRFVSFGVLVHATYLHLYAYLGNRRDRAFRALSTGTLLVLLLVHQWEPLRGTVLELRTVQLAGGMTSIVPVRTPPGLALLVLYVIVLLNNLYGFFVARLIWARDRAGAVLVCGASLAVLVGAALGFLIDFAGVKAPYVGAWPHAIFVFCMTFFLSREYSARGARVAATERQFEAAFEHGPIGKALLALDGRFLGVNRALCRILGWSSEALCARRLADVTHPDDGAEPELPRLEDAPAYIVEKRFLREDGAHVWGRLAVAVVPDDHGRPLRFVAQLQDVTELRAHREKLEELVATRTRELEEAKNQAELANRAKSQFLANISHEIRTPLHIMLSHAQLLVRDSGLNATQQNRLKIVSSSGKHLQALITDVLEMSKIEAGQPELVESPFEPWAMLVELERMFAADAALKRTKLSIERGSDLPEWLLGDEAKVRQILINLASNALKFTSRGSIRLTASARPAAGEALLMQVVVADTGIGIAAEDAARIFQPFEQLDAGKLAGGTGLGLAISLAHARRMGGDLTVESSLGAGSTFTFSYVAKRVARHERPVLESEIVRIDARTKRFKALIVDDVALNRDLLSEFLSGSGFETRTAADGVDALGVHADWAPDLVLIDLRMHGMDGFEAIRRMRAASSDAAIGALSASALEEDERLARALGADFFMRKPYDYGDLLDKISKVLASPARRAVPEVRRGAAS
jgi:PAS domain S-box-containing protein